MFISWPRSSDFFLLCCAKQTHNTALGLLSNSILTRTSVLRHSDCISHLHTVTVTGAKQWTWAHEILTPRPNQRADQKKAFEAFITVFEIATRQCHRLCFWWLAPGIFGDSEAPKGQIVTSQDQGLDWVWMRAWLRLEALLQLSGIKAFGKMKNRHYGEKLPRLWRSHSHEMLGGLDTCACTRPPCSPCPNGHWDPPDPPERYGRLKIPPSKPTVVPEAGLMEFACIGGSVGSHASDVYMANHASHGAETLEICAHNSFIVTDSNRS